MSFSNVDGISSIGMSISTLHAWTYGLWLIALDIIIWLFKKNCQALSLSFENYSSVVCVQIYSSTAAAEGHNIHRASRLLMFVVFIMVYAGEYCESTTSKDPLLFAHSIKIVWLYQPSTQLLLCYQHLGQHLLFQIRIYVVIGLAIASKIVKYSRVVHKNQLRKIS